MSKYKYGVQFLKGDVIGKGSSRRVYQSRLFPNLVVKEARRPEFRGLNLQEAAMWNHAAPSMRRYLARVVDVSPDGQYLLMERTEPISKKLHSTTLIPNALLWDSHSGNTGRGVISGNIVFHDYAQNYESNPVQDWFPKTCSLEELDYPRF